MLYLHHFRVNTLRTAVLSSLLIMITAFLMQYPEPARAQGSTSVVIASPRDGEVLMGNVEIKGTASAAAFLSAELAFAYPNNPANTWFIIGEILQPVMDGDLGTWDTTLISDGDYVLRLRLSTSEGTVEEAAISVQVRNYTYATSPAAGASPTGPAGLQIEGPAVILASPTTPPEDSDTPTPFPQSEASLTPSAVLAGFSRGVVAALAICVLIGVMLIRRRA